MFKQKPATSSPQSLNQSEQMILPISQSSLPSLCHAHRIEDRLYRCQEVYIVSWASYSHQPGYQKTCEHAGGEYMTGKFAFYLYRPTLLLLSSTFSFSTTFSISIICETVRRQADNSQSLLRFVPGWRTGSSFVTDTVLIVYLDSESQRSAWSLDGFGLLVTRGTTTTSFYIQGVSWMWKTREAGSSMYVDSFQVFWSRGPLR